VRREPRADFLAKLEELDGYLTRRKLRQATRAADLLRQLARAETDPAVRAQMVGMVDAQDARVTDLRQQQQRERLVAGARPSKKKPNAKCTKCGLPFRRGKKETRTVCNICRPGDGGSKSVRTVSGGLPTLGKHNR
jgi:hypothetical protein